MDSTNIGAYIKQRASLYPIATAAATLTGVAVDRSGYESCVFNASCGAPTGSPTGFTLDCKLQHSPDGVTWTDTGLSITQITAASTGAKGDVDLTPFGRYIREVAVVTLTGGTSPLLPIHGVITLGGAKTLPAA